jgi:DNA mismatch endonuclease (patch repair protein)
MVDNLKPEDRRKTMQAVKGKGTKLEKRLFAMLAGMKVKGWKKNANNVLGTPDVVFTRERVTIFVDGCFWHGCPKCRRKLPQANRKYWKRKIERNIKLAHWYKHKLINDKWTVIRIWEHELNDPTMWKRIRNDIRQALEESAGYGQRNRKG